MQRELLPWTEIDPLIDHLVSQIDREIDVLLTLNPGGIVPGGILAEALRIDEVQIASIENRKEFELKRQMHDPKLASWPKIRAFPDDESFNGKTVLIVGSAWGTGRCISTVRSRVAGSGGEAFTAVLHYNATWNLFPDLKPDFYAAVTSNWIVYPWEGGRGRKLVLNAV